MTPYDALFGDQELAELLLDTDFPSGSRLDVARARMWEGNHQDVVALTAGAGDPWGTLLVANARANAGLSPVPMLRPIAEDAFKESRVRLWAWTALRKLGEKPSSVHVSEVLGVVVEVVVEDGLDTLAVYSDGGVRFLGHAGQVYVREPGAGEGPDATALAVLSEGYRLLALPPTKRDPKAPPLPPDKVRLTALSANGVQTVTVPWPDVEPGGPYAALFAAATKLLDELTAPKD